jgi:hypothetical protein
MDEPLALFLPRFLSNPLFREYVIYEYRGTHRSIAMTMLKSIVALNG